MEAVNFNDCTLAFLEKRFDLRKTNLATLNKWVQASILLGNFEQRTAQQLSALLTDNVEHWNEQDLSLHFIGPMMSCVRFTEVYRFNLFAQHSIQAEIEGMQLGGRVDEMVASGYREPEIPFFAFNEYKRDQDYKGDARGQALAAMLVGQALNNNPLLPMYGCCVIGRMWQFMVLEGKRYAFSPSLDGTDYDDACQILRILFQLKQYCMERTEAPVL